MLIPAIAKKNELQEKYLKYVYDKRYKYVCALDGYRRTELKIDDSDWNRIQLLSYDDNRIVGYFSLGVSRPDNTITNIAMYNFSLDNAGGIIFARDMRQLFIKIFKELKHPKVKFSVVIGNPIEKSYDNIVKNYGGRIVGTFKNDVLVDNVLCDMKWYEILKKDFLKAIKGNRNVN